jgi:hypothetical protein
VKKLLAAAILAATFSMADSVGMTAAMNPFSDLQAEHWAYDAVARLAKDGVIEGYGDGSYRGDQAITRYEMAQMVARAMTRKGLTAPDQALLDKLAAEFADELNNLGLRVETLENKTDRIKFPGFVRYEYLSDRHEGQHAFNNNHMILRFNPQFQVDEHWKGRLRMEYSSDLNSSQNTVGGISTAGSYFRIDRAYMQGNYPNFELRVGKLSYTSAADMGMVFDNRISGGMVTFGKVFKTTLVAGRYNDHANKADYVTKQGLSYTSNVQGIDLNWQASKKLTLNAAYFHANNGSWKAHKYAGYSGNGEVYGADDRNIWEVGMTYTFSPKWFLNAAYAANTQNNHWARKFNRAYTVEVDYGGGQYPDVAQKGSFGMFAAYRHLGDAAVLGPTYDEMYYNVAGQKGWDLGFAYTLEKNIVGTVKYFTGKDLDANGDKKASLLYGRVDFYF